MRMGAAGQALVALCILVAQAASRQETVTLEAGAQPLNCVSMDRYSDEADEILSRSVFRHSEKARALQEVVTHGMPPGKPPPMEYMSRVERLLALLREERERPCDHRLLVDLSNAWVAVGNLPCACPPLRRLIAVTKAGHKLKDTLGWRDYFAKNIVATCRGVARHWEVAAEEAGGTSGGRSRIRYYNERPDVEEWRDQSNVSTGSDPVKVLLTGRVLANSNYKGCGNRPCMPHSFECQADEDCDGYDVCPARFGGGRVNVVYDTMEMPRRLQEADVVAAFGLDASPVMFSHVVTPPAPRDTYAGRDWNIYTNQTFAVILPEPSHVHSPAMYTRWANPTDAADVTVSYSPMWGSMHSTYVPELPRLGDLLSPPQDKVLGGVACFISSPVQSNGRLEYIEELMRYINVTSYGRLLNNAKIPGDCAADSTTGECRTEGKMRVMPKHSFVLAFENGNEFDYVTEKVYEALQAGAVPVYMGAPNIDKFVPPSSIIRTDDFSGPQELAEYLHRVMANETLYDSYLEWKRHPLPPHLVTLSEETSSRWNLCRLAVVHRARMRNPRVARVNSKSPMVRLPQVSTNDVDQDGASYKQMSIVWRGRPRYSLRYRMAEEGTMKSCYRMDDGEATLFMYENMSARHEYVRAVQEQGGLIMCCYIPILREDTVSNFIERTLMQLMIFENLGVFLQPLMRLLIIGQARLAS